MEGRMQTFERIRNSTAYKVAWSVTFGMWILVGFGLLAANIYQIADCR
jgi:hypothetical protein